MWAISGLLPKSRIFFLGTPLEPPLAPIKQIVFKISILVKFYILNKLLLLYLIKNNKILKVFVQSSVKVKNR